MSSFIIIILIILEFTKPSRHTISIRGCALIAVLLNSKVLLFKIFLENRYFSVDKILLFTQEIK